MWDTIHHAASHLVKRSKDVDFRAYMAPDNGGQYPIFKGPTGAQFTIFALTVFFGFTFVGLLQYTFKLLLTLTVVEEPPAVYLPLSEDTEALNATPKPHLTRLEADRVFITSSIRGTLRHLRREAGIWSPWRGLVPHIVFALSNIFVRAVIISILEIIMPLRLAAMIGGIASMVALSRFALVCTHIMISAPQSTRWWTCYQNTPWDQAKKTIPAVLIWAVALQLVAELSIEATKKGIPSAIRITIFCTDILLYILIAIPATILLVRVQASVLSDDIATIVPFDKTFGQDTSDTDGFLTVQKAINSINCAVFKRVCTFLVKSVPLLIATSSIIVVSCVVMFYSWLPSELSFQ
ncbi:hypothetical protein BGX38DRAFT_1162321 [Terfezia claveryi]|nr:hypothetical protein BGX38DRAFT_1162321 [Terfezia claveryi]